MPLQVPKGALHYKSFFYQATAINERQSATTGTEKKKPKTLENKENGSNYEEKKQLREEYHHSVGASVRVIVRN